MREIKIAKSAGFCFGVKRAVNLVYDQVGNAKKVYTYGPIIHNEEVVSDLERKGVHVLSEEDIDAMLAHDGREDDAKEIVIRSHGIGRDAYKKLEQLGFEIVDATCPFVKKIHRIVQEETEQGHCVVIVGDENHPEVCGIRGWCVREPIIVNSVEQAQKKLDFLDKNVYIVAQTTFNDVKFKDIVEFFRNKGYNVIVYNTICNATEERQREARALAAADYPVSAECLCEASEIPDLLSGNHPADRTVYCQCGSDRERELKYCGCLCGNHGRHYICGMSGL